MLIDELINNYELGVLSPINKECSNFFIESQGTPLVKSLPRIYSDIQKVKVRKRKNQNSFSNAFNSAFVNDMRDLRERSIFVHNTHIVNETHEEFYIFPIDGFKFLYNKTIEDSVEDYKKTFESIFNSLESSADTVFSDLLRLTYISEDLQAGMNLGSELILYGIPYYYAIRVSSVDDYDELLTVLK